MNQVIEDASTNGYTAINGKTLFEESEDVIWTDRGAYFGGSSLITLPKNDICNQNIDFELGSSTLFWIMPLSDGSLLLKDNLHLYIQNSSLRLQIENSSASASLPGGALGGNIYSGEWMLLSLDISGTSNLTFQVRVKNNGNATITISLSSWTEDLTDLDIGNSFTGFIYYIQIYDSSIELSDLSNGDFYTDGSGCYFPALEGDCLSTQIEPSRNKDGVSCLCSQSVSCLDEADQCIESLLCDVYSKPIDPENCLDPSPLCGSSQYLSSSRKCNFDCIDYCEICTSSPTSCDQCASGFFYSSSSQTCDCNPGYFLDSGSCIACDPLCPTCSSSSVCLSCESAYYLSGSSCLSCPSKCLSCDSDSECTACSDENSSIISGLCVCKEGFEDREGKCGRIIENCEQYTYQNQDQNQEEECESCKAGFFLKTDGTCSECGEECSKCSESDRCSECKDNKAELEEGICICNKAGSVKKDGECLCEEGLDLWEEEEDWGCSEDSTEQEEQENQKEIEENIEEETEMGTIKEIKSTTYSIAVSLAVSFINMITMDDPTALWTLLNTYQFVSYLPVLSVDFPGDVSNFLVSFQLGRFLPNFFVSRNSGGDTPENFKEYGEEIEEFQDLDSLKNTGRYILLLGIFGTLNCLFYFVGPLLPFKRIKEKSLKERECWISSTLRLWNSLSLDLAIPSSLLIFSYTNLSFLSMLWAILIFQVNIHCIFEILQCTREQIKIQNKDPEVYNKIGTFLEELSNNNLWSSRFYFVLNLRKTIYALTIIFFYENPRFVLVPQIFFSVVSVIYFFAGKVFKDKTTTALHTMGEVTLFITFTSSLLLQEINGYSSEFGYAIIAINVGFIFLGTSLKIFMKAFMYIKEKCAQRIEKTHVICFNVENSRTPDAAMGESRSVRFDNSNWEDSYFIFSQRNNELY